MRTLIGIYMGFISTQNIIFALHAGFAGNWLHVLWHTLTAITIMWLFFNLLHEKSYP